MQYAPRLSAILRAAYFLPVAATLVAMAVVWQMLLHPNLGLVNHMLAAAGISGPAWLSDRGLVLYTLAVIGVWQTVGYNMVLFLAGLAAIPQHLYDAAEVDGADRGWERFWTVTWPMLGPTTLFVTVVTATGAFRVFETVATLTRGGPAFASDVLVYAIYREGFVYFKAGYSSAITMVFFAFVLLFTVVKFRFMEKRVHCR
ncbi:MAG: sugar ABC transporter permease [Mesorhizobium sp.]|nr:sugar ABC transporter permease [Mesorhizobium sp.]